MFFAGNAVVIALFHKKQYTTPSIILAVITLGAIALHFFGNILSLLVAEWISLAVIGIHFILEATGTINYNAIPPQTYPNPPGHSCCWSCCCPPWQAGASQPTWLVGTYTNGGSTSPAPPKDSTGSKGIYVYGWDTVTGHARLLNHAAAVNPSFLTVSADGKYVYAAHGDQDDERGKHQRLFVGPWAASI